MRTPTTTGRTTATLAITVLLLTTASCASHDTIEICADPSVRDYTPVVREILENHPKGNVTLKFSSGTFCFYPEEATGKYLTVSNNDNGMKRIIFCIDGMRNVAVECDSSDFMFYGAVIPFSVSDSRNIRLSGFSIDYDSPFTLEGTVIATDPVSRTFTMKIDPANRYKILDERFYFLGYGWESRLGENIVFNPETRSPYYNTAAYQHWPLHQFTAEEMGDGTVRFGNIYSKDLPPVGSVWVDKGVHPQERYCSAIVLSDSRNISVENVHIYHSGAMALIAQYCEDITVRGYSTAQHPGSSRMVTASADATHFVDCRGKILLEDCTFESMLDDASNIHGTYMQVERFLSGDEFAASFGHRQQEGNRFAERGDVLQFIDRTTMMPAGKGKVLSVRRVNEDWYIIRTDFPLNTLGKPEQYAVENTSRGASAVIRNCTVRYNRARGILISTPGRVLVENCRFSPMMAGIVICGDANYWYESGSTNDITIRNCIFRNVGTGGHSPQAVLQIDPMISSEGRSNDSFYHRKISFTDNLVETFDSQLIYALSVGDLEIRNNIFRNSGAYPPIFGNLAAIDVLNCGNVTIRDNDFSGWKKNAYISLHECRNADISAGKLEITDRPNPYFYGNSN